MTLDSEQLYIFCDELSRHNVFAQAAAKIGMSVKRVRQIIRQDKKARQAIRSARAKWEADRVQIVAAGEKGWQSSAWLLERMYPSRYGNRTRIDSEDLDRTIQTLLEQVAGSGQAQAGVPIGANGLAQPLSFDSPEVLPAHAPPNPAHSVGAN